MGKTAHDIVAGLSGLHAKEATKIARAPTGVTPGYNRKLGAAVTEDGRLRYVAESGLIGALAFGAGTVSTTSGTATAIDLDTPQFDTGGFWVGATSERLIAPSDGYYMGIASASFATNATGDRRVTLEHISADGSDLGGIFVTTVLAANGRSTSIQCSGPYYLTAGQGFQLIATQWSGGALDVTTASSLVMWLL